MKGEKIKTEFYNFKPNKCHLTHQSIKKRKRKSKSKHNRKKSLVKIPTDKEDENYIYGMKSRRNR